ncbi:EAL domain-containing protein [Sinirhodobacter huangdaonensis]|uniref:EAL domain-containing protein n=1 Tax=Paenirhodobacter huangdaonensis TaxID=2501515 RepID=A0A3S3LR00_9RHOB|nr:EAL domain-containing protein [Sinirhodobacter huangdaonensis]RWR54948.1 EAL domain-containing protein [Sinirhodobacter huangdaonensis]
MSKRELPPQEPLEPALTSPLDFAIAQRDRDVIDMVRHAIERRDVILAFQPIVRTASPERPAFYEGLIRVLDETGRIIPAKEFIETVERTELGRRLDCLALEMGLASLAEDRHLRLAINMSARSIGYPDWMKTLNKGLALDDTAAERLILEITESSAMSMPEIVSVFMRDLQARGVSFALDDFGAGYTSFRYLREFYFDILKIDGQFITGIAESADNQVLTAALISIAQHFDMFTVAEAVENAADAAFLTTLGIDCMQGYYFGAPTVMPPWKVPESAKVKRA